MQVVVCPLRWVEHLPLLCEQAVALPVACCQPPADVALTKLFKAVVALIEQILQVPAPWLGMLKHKDRQKHTQSHPRHLKVSMIKAISLNLWNMTDATSKLHVKSVINAEMKKAWYLYGIEVHVLSPRPTLMKRETLIFIVSPSC